MTFRHSPRFTLALVSLIILASSCKTANDNSEVTPTRISDALLSITDLDTGWSQSSRQVYTSRASDNPAIDTQWCPGAMASAAQLIQLAGDRGALVDLKFAGSIPSSRTLSEDAWNDENAQSFMSKIKAVIDSCNGKTWTDEVGVTATLTKTSGRSFGDDSAGFSVAITPPASMAKQKFPEVCRTIAVRTGSTIMILEVWDSSKSNVMPDAISGSAWTSIVGAATDKLAKL